MSAGFNRQRVNTRSFTVTDTFGGLIRDVGNDYCNKKFMVTENYVYPITGRIGIENMVHDFINMTLFANLRGDVPDGKELPTLVDALDSRTAISGSAVPQITFSPLGTGLSVRASLTGKLAVRISTRSPAWRLMAERRPLGSAAFNSVTPLLTATSNATNRGLRRPSIRR